MAEHQQLSPNLEPREVEQDFDLSCHLQTLSGVVSLKLTLTFLTFKIVHKHKNLYKILKEKEEKHNGTPLQVQYVRMCA